MAKLYAELTSDKGGRVASKGGEEYVTLTTTHKGSPFWIVTIGASGTLRITYNNATYTFNSLTWDKELK